MGSHTFQAPKPESSQIRTLGYKLRFVVVPIVLVLVGLVLILTPVISTQFYNWQQTHKATQYSEAIQQQELEALEAERLRAQEWNSSATRSLAVDPWTGNVDHSTPEYQHYLEQLNILPVMARVQVPSAGIDLPVYHGTDEHTLAQGVGHLFGTDLPVGGIGNHAVLTGHTGISTATLFDNLVDVSDGDFMAVETLGESLVYQVTDIQVVLPDQVDTLRADPDRDLLTLITCTPYGINSHRLLITGERIYGTELPAEASVGLPSWMLWAIGLSILIIVVTLFWIIQRKKGPQ